MEMLKRFFYCGLVAALVCMFFPALASAAGLTVLTVPEDPTTLTTPHTTYPAATIVLGATCPSCVGSTDSFTVDWSFGDGTPDAVFALTNPYDISTTHVYAGSAAQTWTATVTVTDTTNPANGSANYLVIMEANTLASRVDVAIDWGLWYMHQTMWRQNSPANGQTVNWGGWDTQIFSCPTVNGNAWDCFYYGSIDANNVQAFEVSGHTAGETNAAIDPYADDVSRGAARMLVMLANQGNNTDTYYYNPATSNYSCNIGGTIYDPYVYYTSSPYVYPYCAGTGTQVFYEPAATSCLSPPCAFTPDGNSNGQMIYSADLSGEPIYTTGPFIDALVASGTPTAVAPTGTPVGGGLPGIQGQTYQNIVQDMVDWYASCQWGNDYDTGNSYTNAYEYYYRGGGYSGSGGGWLYQCQQGDDNSTSQWAAIGLIAGYRGFGLAVPQQVIDFNSTWVTNSQTGLYMGFGAPWAYPTGTDPWAAGDLGGSFGYRGDLAQSDAWGGFATTPSGMVQMALDGIGRTLNTAFGDPSTAADQRFNNAETYYADNFCNNTSSGAVNAPRAYTYGMFSFTKSMLLHDPGGSLQAIQYLRTQTPSVFTGDLSDPANTIDWYAGLSPANGGSDACDGVAQTLVSYQLNPSNGVFDGHWYGEDYYAYQMPYETAWSIIMLRKTVFISCVSNLYGRGTPGHGAITPRIDLTWGAQTGATSYNVLRGTANGGPYTLIGNTVSTAYSDKGAWLTNGDTYYYVLQPLEGETEVCQSNQEPVTIP